MFSQSLGLPLRNMCCWLFLLKIPGLVGFSAEVTQTGADGEALPLTPGVLHPSKPPLADPAAILKARLLVECQRCVGVTGQV